MLLDKLLKIEDNWVVFFDMFSKNGNGDSIKPIAEELRCRRPDMKFFFCDKKKHRLRHIDMADEIITEKTLKFKYICSKAKYIISPMGFPNGGKKRRGQVFVQTWHGSPIKKLYLSRNKKNPKFIRYAKQFVNTDFFCLQGEIFRKLYMKAFNLKSNQFIESGIPRNIELITGISESKKNAIKEKLQLPLDKKIILYAPTWKRYDYKAILPFDLSYLKKELKDNYVLIIRSHVGKHQWVNDNLESVEIFDNEFCFDGALAENANELYHIADISISDYSSVIFDFGLLKKPQILYIYDYEQYKKEFGLYFDYSNFTPFPKVKTQEELVSAIKNYNVTAKEYDKFLADFCNYENINAAKKIVSKMLGENYDK